MNDTRGSKLLALALLSSVAWCATASAETQDHMKCYRTEDASEAAAAADVEALAFGLDAACTVEGKVRELCVPASADVVAADPSQDDFAGDDLGTERLCYEISCPERALPAVQVTDRFGSRVVGVRRARLLCLPVIAPP
jgi:hypothetical protein